MAFLRARYYEPTTGRFIRSDPIAGDDRDTQRRNLYVYASNNPIRATDPSGFDTKFVKARLSFFAFGGGGLEFGVYQDERTGQRVAVINPGRL